MKILYAIPTYRRAGEVHAIKLFDDPVLFVDTSELEIYKKKHPKVKIVEHKGEKGLTPKLNTILKYARDNGYDAVWKSDDDVQSLSSFAGGYTQRYSDPKIVRELIERCAVMAKDAGTPLFMVRQSFDIRKYQAHSPFSFFTTKFGFFGLLTDNDIHFDERFVLKQDIDLALQILHDYRFFIVDNRYSFNMKGTMGSKGGCFSYRTRKREQETMDLLKRKWGSGIFKEGTSKRASIYTLNISNPFK